jgi:hypothetical protein
MRALLSVEKADFADRTSLLLLSILFYVVTKPWRPLKRIQEGNNQGFNLEEKVIDGSEPL